MPANDPKKTTPTPAQPTQPAPPGVRGQPAGGSDGDAHDLRELFVFRAGGRLFAVYREEVEATAANLRPAPLPFAPPAVLGVVPLRGRSRTALDPLKLFAPGATADTSHRLFVALAGDEQLALACDEEAESFTVSPAEVTRPAVSDAADADSTPARGHVERGGATVTLLDPSRLFEAAMRGTDRRRRRA